VVAAIDRVARPGFEDADARILPELGELEFQARRKKLERKQRELVVWSLPDGRSATAARTRDREEHLHRRNKAMNQKLSPPGLLQTCVSEKVEISSGDFSLINLVLCVLRASTDIIEFVAHGYPVRMVPNWARLLVQVGTRHINVIRKLVVNVRVRMQLDPLELTFLGGQRPREERFWFRDAAFQEVKKARERAMAGDMRKAVVSARGEAVSREVR
jgi:hypothetical protein